MPISKYGSQEVIIVYRGWDTVWLIQMCCDAFWAHTSQNNLFILMKDLFNYYLDKFVQVDMEDLIICSESFEK